MSRFRFGDLFARLREGSAAKPVAIPSVLLDKGPELRTSGKEETATSTATTTSFQDLPFEIIEMILFELMKEDQPIDLLDLTPRNHDISSPPALVKFDLSRFYARGTAHPILFVRDDRLRALATVAYFRANHFIVTGDKGVYLLVNIMKQTELKAKDFQRLTIWNDEKVYGPGTHDDSGFQITAPNFRIFGLAPLHNLVNAFPMLVHYSFQFPERAMYETGGHDCLGEDLGVFEELALERYLYGHTSLRSLTLITSVWKNTHGLCDCEGHTSKWLLDKICEHLNEGFAGNGREVKVDWEWDSRFAQTH